MPVQKQLDFPQQFHSFIWEYVLSVSSWYQDGVINSRSNAEVKQLELNQFSVRFWGAVSSGVEQLRCNANMVAQGHVKFDPGLTLEFLQHKKALSVLSLFFLRMEL